MLQYMWYTEDISIDADIIGFAKYPPPYIEVSTKGISSSKPFGNVFSVKVLNQREKIIQIGGTVNFFLYNTPCYFRGILWVSEYLLGYIIPDI